MVQAALAHDTAILLSACRGGETAFAGLYERYSASIYNLALRSIRDPQLAEDLCQEIWVKVHREIVHLQEANAFAAWLYRIAARMCVDAARKRLRAPAVVPIAEDMMRTDEGPEGSAIRREQARLTWEALGALPARQHWALFLKEVEGCSYGEIAQIMEASESAVEDLLFRARRGFARAYSCMQTAPATRCQYAHQAMAVLIDGEATIVQQRALRAHVEACQGCRNGILEMRRASAAYGGLALTPVPAVLGTRILETIGLGSSLGKASGLLKLIASAVVKGKSMSLTLAVTGGITAATLAMPDVARDTSATASSHESMSGALTTESPAAARPTGGSEVAITDHGEAATGTFTGRLTSEEISEGTAALLDSIQAAQGVIFTVDQLLDGSIVGDLAVGDTTLPELIDGWMLQLAPIETTANEATSGVDEALTSPLNESHGAGIPLEPPPTVPTPPSIVEP